MLLFCCPWDEDINSSSNSMYALWISILSAYKEATLSSKYLMSLSFSSASDLFCVIYDYKFSMRVLSYFSLEEDPLTLLFLLL